MIKDYKYVRSARIASICPAVILTIHFRGIQAYPLSFLIDTGADLNLARKNCFPEDAWKKGNTKITFANQDKEGSDAYCVAPVTTRGCVKPIAAFKKKFPAKMHFLKF